MYDFVSLKHSASFYSAILSSQCMNFLSSGACFSLITAMVRFFSIILRRKHIYVMVKFYTPGSITLGVS